MTSAPFQVVDPATGETNPPHDFFGPGQVEDALQHAHDAGSSWSDRAVEDRAEVLRRVARYHRDHLEDLATRAVREMGKPLAQARAEVEFSADIYDYYADNAAQFLAETPIALSQGPGSAVIRKRPIGVVLGIMPWNFPYYQVARFVAPSLAVGNTVLLKPAPQCPDSAQALTDAFAAAGAPTGVYTTALFDETTIASVIADSRVAGVSFTGSERAGTTVGQLAGANIKKVVLELGGSDPFLVLDLADLTAAVDAAVEARLDNGGQSCNGAKRFIILDHHYDEFVARFTEKLAAVSPGDPMDESTVLGPLSSVAAAGRLEAQVRRATDAGATALLDSTRDGAYFGCGVLADVTADNPVHHEELFGPVAIVYRAADERDAVRIANDTPFGLGSYVFTDDADQAARVADSLQTGMVFVNGVGLDAAELPFGGVKRSGIGRELGALGIEEFVNKQLVRSTDPR
ncbi:NAD-dependent succinate-semialdehyde dehydrogenase [Rhodococcus fascians]|nr:NAD-dependent succinate-semialdehyde dehydrogenase [Rhodococcus fascians]MBY4140901.1 NAD-dependent succinate-semialdehyde dehydrogenase [Rhodococcus fascians]MBY4219565.1 NAD-dependent succinate-semialdehyde dehydrogenase [Rhodococcus fascians]MBY4221874.1 NAD-dependent succinate-semialdehyde dehydrogenase [Rhodococcus fascians]MBY4233875.1 NAD-dependent succinate-semialdehyde dehydrogenase [Rhodococcus fascians]